MFPFSRLFKNKGLTARPGWLHREAATLKGGAAGADPQVRHRPHLGSPTLVSI